MKVYAAERHYDHEGFSLLGIFTTKAAAQTACDNDRWPEGDKFGDHHEVNEYELES